MSLAAGTHKVPGIKLCQAAHADHSPHVINIFGKTSDSNNEMDNISALLAREHRIVITHQTLGVWHLSQVRDL
jgi:hypothetical protein